MANAENQSNGEPETMPKAIASGKLRIGEKIVECHVLDDGRRVLDTSQAMALFGASKNRMFRRLLGRIPNISKDLTLHPSIAFHRKEGGTANAYEGTFIMDVCLAYQTAFLQGLLHHFQRPIAMEAMGIVAAYAKIGMDAAIDEATGYQVLRPGDYLEKKAIKLLREFKAAWQRCWTEDVVAAFCKLYGKPYSVNPKFMQPVAGKVYNILMGAETMGVLRARNPLPRKNDNHHQYFRDHVRAVLDRELHAIAVLAKTSPSKDRFWHLMEVTYLNKPQQLGLYD